ncbi:MULTISPECIES: hypothetical protein [Pseudomonadaceae]|nr:MULTISPECIES: hypothetical protein [Pseudomonas]
MAGDLILPYVTDETLTTLTDAGGSVGSEVHHADKYSKTAWDVLEARLHESKSGITTNNRVGLPPHFYISFSLSNYKGSGQVEFKKLIKQATRPLTIVTSHPGLGDWNTKRIDEVSAEKCFHEALQRASITLEIYGYDNKPLINRTTGTINGSISYMKKINEH